MQALGQALEVLRDALARHERIDAGESSIISTAVQMIGEECGDGTLASSASSLETDPPSG